MYGETVQQMTVRDALNSAMAEEMQRDEKVMLLGEVRVGNRGARHETSQLTQPCLAPNFPGSRAVQRRVQD